MFKPKSIQETLSIGLLALALCLNGFYWLTVRQIQSKWTNVPDPPPARYAAAAGLGDASLAYRMNAITIQNFGDTGGRLTPLKDYNHENLARWFFVQDHLDPRSAHIPYLAAYYFSASQDTSKIRPIIEYLAVIGNRTKGENWRWLAQAVFLARFKLGDMDYALELARTLATLPKDDLPTWARQMPGFVLNARGEKEAAYAMLLEMLKTSRDKMHPEEVTNTLYYICQSILTPAEAKANPLCKDIKL